MTAEHYFDTTNLQWLQPEAQLVGDWIEREASQMKARQSGENVVPLKAG